VFEIEREIARIQEADDAHCQGLCVDRGRSENCSRKNGRKWASLISAWANSRLRSGDLDGGDIDPYRGDAR